MPIISSAILFSASVRATPHQFAPLLFSQWCDGNQNVIFSPYSISAALAMTAAGAQGESAAQIRQLLQQGESNDALVESYGASEKLLQEAREASPNLQLAVANSLWPQQDYPIRAEYSDLIRNKFMGEILPVNYATEAEAARLRINGWVEDKTANRIKDLIAEGLLRSDTRVTLVNAIYFLGLWAKPFNAELTAEAPFYGAKGVEKPAMFMQRRGEMRYGMAEGVQALELPYAGDRFAMLILLPDKDKSVKEIASLWREQGVKIWDDTLRQREVELALPRFRSEWMTFCTQTLKQNGVTEIFGNKADLSGIAGKPGDLIVSEVIHKAFIEVTEKGTEAAAATAVIMRLAAMIPENPVVFRAERPFAYLIRERKSGIVLFAGVVAQP